MIKYLYFLAFYFTLLSCHQNRMSREELWSMVKSKNVDSIVIATIEIQKLKDTTMISALLYKAEDPRITHRRLQKGMSVYQIKMNALRQITGLEPPNRITYEVDTSIISFYNKHFGISSNSR